MFNLGRSQNENNSNDKNIKSDFLKFSNGKKDELLETLAVDNKFVKEEMKIRSMVIEMLEKEFGKDIKDIKGYDYLVDSVVNKLKKKQNDSIPSLSD